MALGCPAAMLCLLGEHLQSFRLCWLSNLGKGREISAPSELAVVSTEGPLGGEEVLRGISCLRGFPQHVSKAAFGSV